MNLTIVQTHPQLLKVLASKNPYYVLAFATPLAVLFIIGVIQASHSPLALFIAFAGGFLYWSLFEYLVHRFPYHTRFKNSRVRWFIESFHLYHHRVREDKRVLNSGPLMLYPMTPLLLAPFWIFGLSLNLISAIGLGLVVYYVFYEFVHYLIHQKVHHSGYLCHIQKFHLYHHDKAWNKNFGNTLTLWDRLFGSYDPQYKTHQITQL